MKKLFSTNGSRVGVIKMNPDTVNEKLQPRIYSVGFCEMSGFYLNIIKDKFTVPDVIFGDHKKRAEKVINTYNSRNNSTGVLLTGNKGSGKSMLTELISNIGIDNGLPVVMVTEEYTGDNFITFINDIGECILLFDEFAKVYEEEQQTLLSLLDGTMSGRRLILFTENRCSDINEFMLNRPGRIFYHFKYNKLGEDFIAEFCKYHNVEEIIEDLKYIRSTALEFSVDVLLSIVEEYKRYGGKVGDIVTDMNIDVGNVNKTKLYIEKIERKGGVVIDNGALLESVFEVDLDNIYYTIDIKIRTDEKYIVSNKPTIEESSDTSGDYDYVSLYRRDMVYENFNYIILSNNEYTIKFRKEIPSGMFNWDAF